MDGDINPNLGVEPEPGAEPEEAGGWSNPPFALRVALVALVCTAPGILTALMVNLAIGFTGHTAIVATTGAVLSAFCGGWLEATG